MISVVTLITILPLSLPTVLHTSLDSSTAVQDRKVKIGQSNTKLCLVLVRTHGVIHGDLYIGALFSIHDQVRRQ